MKFTITDASTLDPVALADELTTVLGSNYGISTAGTEITTNTPEQPDEVAFQAVLDAHVASAPVRAQAKVIKALTDKVQAYMDKEAQKLGYDTLISACSYAAGTTANKYKTEGLSFLNWRSNVWDYCYAQAALPTLPTEAELFAGLPVR
jgi:hypothetical protein